MAKKSTDPGYEILPDPEGAIPVQNLASQGYSTLDDEEDEEEQEEEETEDDKPYELIPQLAEPNKSVRGKAGTTPEDDESDDDYAEDEEEEETNSFSFAPVINELAQKGILDFDPEEEYEDSEDGFEQVLTYTATKRFDAFKEDYLSSIPEEDQNFLEFRRQGGSLQDYLSGMQAQSYADVDLDDTGTQKALISKQMEIAGFSSDKIATKLARLERDGQLQFEAEDSQEFLVGWEQNEKQAFEQGIVKRQQAAEASSVQEKKQLKADIEALTDVRGFPLDAKAKNRLFDHLTKPVTRDGKTQIRVNQEKRENALASAYFDMIGLEMPDVQRRATTTATSTYRKELAKKNQSDKLATNTGGRNVRAAITTNRIPKGPWDIQ